MVESSTADDCSFLSFILCLGFLAFRVVDFTFIVLNALVVGVVLVGTVCLLSIILSRCSFLFVTYTHAYLKSIININVAYLCTTYLSHESLSVFS